MPTIINSIQHFTRGPEYSGKDENKIKKFRQQEIKLILFINYL